MLTYLEQPESANRRPPASGLLHAEFVALIKQWRAIRDRQQSARRVTIGDTYEDAENFIAAMERIESHARGLGI